MSIFLDAITGKLPDEVSLEDLGRLFVANQDCDAPPPDYGKALQRLEQYRLTLLLNPCKVETVLINGTPPEQIETLKIPGLYIGDQDRELLVIAGTNSPPQPAAYKEVYFFSRDEVRRFLDSAVGRFESCRDASALRSWLGESAFPKRSEGDNTLSVDAVERGRYEGLSQEAFVSREDLIARYPNLESATRETGGELASMASCVRLVKDGQLNMPKGFPPDGRGYWVLPEAAAWHGRKFQGNVSVTKQRRQPRHG